MGEKNGKIYCKRSRFMRIQHGIYWLEAWETGTLPTSTGFMYEDGGLLPNFLIRARDYTVTTCRWSGLQLFYRLSPTIRLAWSQAKNTKWPKIKPEHPSQQSFLFKLNMISRNFAL